MILKLTEHYWEITDTLLRPDMYDYLVLYRLQRSCIRRRTLFRVHAAFESHKLDLLPEASKLRTKDEDDLNRFTYSITPLLSPKKVLEKWGIDPFQPWNSWSEATSQLLIGALHRFSGPSIIRLIIGNDNTIVSVSVKYETWGVFDKWLSSDKTWSSPSRMKWSCIYQN